MRFELVFGGQRLAGATWVQVRHPESYRGNEYVSSFSLEMTTDPQGELTALAKNPGRYKIAGSAINVTAEACVLVRPENAAPLVRGSAFRTPAGPIGAKSGPLDRTAAANSLHRASLAGIAWAELDPAGFMDFDTDVVVAHQYCEVCYGSITVDDFEWLVDAAHDEGMSVVISTGLWARWHGEMYELSDVLIGNLRGGTPAPTSSVRSGTLPAPSDERIQPEVMRAYGAYVDQIAALATRHKVEALMLFAGGTGAQLWKQAILWRGIVAQLRREYAGQLWSEGADICPATGPFSQEILGLSYLFPAVDGMLSNTSELLLTVSRNPQCPGFGQYPQNPERPTPLNADTLAARLAPALDGIGPFELQAANGKLVLFTDLYTCNLEGVSYKGPTVCSQGPNSVQNDQEIVDAFEALMSTLGQRKNVGLLLWTISLSPDPAAARSDPLQHPALAAALANWWGR